MDHSLTPACLDQTTLPKQNYKNTCHPSNSAPKKHPNDIFYKHLGLVARFMTFVQRGTKDARRSCWHPPKMQLRYCCGFIGDAGMLHVAFVAAMFFRHHPLRQLDSGNLH
eukprot:Platyproteum_vivax@DN8834_c0_g1_i1.p1